MGGVVSMDLAGAGELAGREGRFQQFSFSLSDYSTSYETCPCCWERLMRSMSPASTNSTHEARTAGSPEALTSKLCPVAGAFESLGIVCGGEHLHLNFHAPAEDFGDFPQAVLLDIFAKDNFDRFGDYGVQHLPFAHLMAAHQVEFEFSEGRAIEAAQIADPRNSGLFAQNHASLPRGRNHRAVIRDAKPGSPRIVDR